jgi:tetraacyldisaccharide 4'-kinase
MKRPAPRGPVPVICVGNPTVGGAGKSPTTQAIAARLAALGETPAIVTRGYGGSLQGPVLVDPAAHTPAEVGDEALTHAALFPTVVGRDRLAAARLAVEAGASIVVMDDGFQNPSLAKDLSLLVVDGAVGFGNGRVLPAGPLRAPFLPQLALAHALVVVGDGEAGEAVADLARKAGKPVLAAGLVPDAAALAPFLGRNVLAFCGIGRPEKFVETLGQAGIRNAVLRPFPDHHAYAEEDAAQLLGEAARTGLPLVTTAKDRVKLAGGPEREALARAATVVPVVLEFAEPVVLDGLIARVRTPRV